MTGSTTRPASTPIANAAASKEDFFAAYVERMSTPFAVTRGARYVLTCANAAFLRLVGVDEEPRGQPVTEVLRGRAAGELRLALDVAVRTAAVVRDRRLDRSDADGGDWYVTVWPIAPTADGSSHLLIELRAATADDVPLDLHRDVAERILLTALRAHDVADLAAALNKRSTYIAGASRRLAQSLDVQVTLRAITELSLPDLGAWCIVDLLNADGTMRRLPFVHPDPAKHALVPGLEERWLPQRGDQFGGPAAVLGARTTLLVNGVDAALAASARDEEILPLLRELGIGHLLTVPLVIRGLLVGAVTFVAPRGSRFTEHDVALAEELVARSALALDSARVHLAAITLQLQAESASKAKSEFLGTMSHELRTPLAAIGGYLDIIDMGLHGPVTDAQHTDMSRMRHSLDHLVRLVNDILTMVRIGRRQLQIDSDDVRVVDVLSASVDLVEPLIHEKHLAYDGIVCDSTVVMHADAEKVKQILVNLLSNAIKFTPSEGWVGLACEALDQTVRIRVTDSGIGIPSDKLEAIFEPFVQVSSELTRRGVGVGLGLAISRELARAMNGDLSVESTLGAGSRFTLTLPRGGDAHGRDR